MRAFQFWFLIVISIIVAGLMIEQIFLSRQLTHEQRILVDSQETITQGTSYENAWQKLSMGVYQIGHQDPALLTVLKNNDVEIHAKAPAGADAGSLPSQSAPSPVAPVPATSSKAPVPSAHPATP